MLKWRTIILAVCVPAVVVVCGYGCWRSLDPTIGFSADASRSPVRDLPASAKNVRYYLPGAFGPAKAYDFDVDEPAFEAWVKTLSPPLVASGPGLVHCVDPVHGPDGRHEITDGQVYSWRHEDAAVEAAYDRSLGHAFYYRSYR